MPEFPAWINQCRISDSLIDAAYESAPPLCRAALKTAIALAANYFNPRQIESDCGIIAPRQGFGYKTRTRPCDWAALVFETDYPCALLTAAAVLPVLCGVKNVFALCPDGLPNIPQITALTLCGVEDIFSINPDQLSTLLTQLQGSGRVFFSTDQSGISLQNMNSDLLIYREPASLKLLMPEPCVDASLWNFLHGAAKPDQAPLPGVFYDAAYYENAPENWHEIPARLILSPPLAGFWLHPRLEPDFFTCEKTLFCMIEGALDG